MIKSENWDREFNQFYNWYAQNHRFPSTKDKAQYSWIRKQIAAFKSGGLLEHQISNINSISYYILHPTTNNIVKEATLDIEGKWITATAPDFARNKNLTIEESKYLMNLGLFSDRDVINFLIKASHIKTREMGQIKANLGYETHAMVNKPKVNSSYTLGLFRYLDSTYSESMIDFIVQVTTKDIWDLFELNKSEFNPEQLCLRAMRVFLSMKDKIQKQYWDAGRLKWVGSNPLSYVSSFLGLNIINTRGMLQKLTREVRANDKLLKYLLNGETIPDKQVIEIKSGLGLPYSSTIDMSDENRMEKFRDLDK